MSITKKCVQVFQRAIEDYHLIDSVEQELNNPYKKEDIFIKNLYKKSWIDTIHDVLAALFIGGMIPCWNHF